jgi:hypothetical protein
MHILGMFFVERAADDFADGLRRVYLGDVSTIREAIRAQTFCGFAKIVRNRVLDIP